ncbi:hypothetical protein POPA111323_08920 [Polynucleobacter paneuropaeus]
MMPNTYSFKFLFIDFFDISALDDFSELFSGALTKIYDF